MDNNFDVAIIGGGAGGLSAGIYVKRANKKVCVIEKGALGGMLSQIDKIENYPALGSIDGFELAQKLYEHCESFGVDFIYDSVEKFDLKSDIKVLTLSSGEEVKAKAVIIAMGSSPRPLGVKNEKELTGSGISYCATCDGAFFKDKTVMVAGAGKSAMDDVAYLSPIAKKIYVVNDKRLPKFTQSNVEPIENADIVELKGSPLQSAVLKMGDNKKEIEVSGIFVSKGYSPATEDFKNILELDSTNHIVTDSKMQTSIKNVYAVGDIRANSLKQVVTACADGAIAGTQSIHIK